MQLGQEATDMNRSMRDSNGVIRKQFFIKKVVKHCKVFLRKRWSLHPWRYSRSWATGSRWPCLFSACGTRWPPELFANPKQPMIPCSDKHRYQDHTGIYSITSSLILLLGHSVSIDFLFQKPSVIESELILANFPVLLSIRTQQSYFDSGVKLC